VCGHKYLGFNHKHHVDMANAVHIQSSTSRLEVYRNVIILLLNLRKLLKITFVNVRDGLEISYITKQSYIYCDVYYKSDYRLVFSLRLKEISNRELLCARAFVCVRGQLNQNYKL
jgi:hypothetical protein